MSRSLSFSPTAVRVMNTGALRHSGREQLRKETKKVFEGEGDVSTSPLSKKMMMYVNVFQSVADTAFYLAVLNDDLDAMEDFLTSGLKGEDTLDDYIIDEISPEMMDLLCSYNKKMAFELWTNHLSISDHLDLALVCLSHCSSDDVYSDFLKKDMEGHYDQHEEFRISLMKTLLSSECVPTAKILDTAATNHQYWFIEAILNEQLEECVPTKKMWILSEDDDVLRHILRKAGHSPREE